MDATELTVWLERFWPLLLTSCSFLASASATIHAVLYKRDSRAVIGWVGLVWLAPVIGAVLYFALGINRIQRKALALEVKKAWAHRDEVRIRPEDRKHGRALAKDHPTLVGLSQLGENVTGHHLLPGNHVEPLVNGDEAYPAMLSAINQAERSISLMSYIFDADRAGDRFLEALVRAKARGVEVRVLIDDVGARYSSPSMIKRLRKVGVPVGAFLRTRAPGKLKYSNLRNHRKILVVDGRVGFTGGTNIREGHWLALNPSHPIHCMHFRIEGPVVTHLQEAFVVDWAFATGESLRGEAWFADPAPTGRSWARGIPDGPDEDLEALLNTLMAGLAAADRTVRIITPYFLPESALIHALSVAALRGVEVSILLPSRNNLPLVQWASTAQYPLLLEKGCRIFLSPPPFDHTKLMVVDGVWSLIGSSNWDPRSLRLNFEYNVECYDAELAERLEAIAETKFAQATEVTLDDAPSLPLRLRNGLARLLTPYL